MRRGLYESEANKLYEYRDIYGLMHLNHLFRRTKAGWHLNF
jgi:hypothetical protein